MKVLSKAPPARLGSEIGGNSRSRNRQEIGDKEEIGDRPRFHFIAQFIGCREKLSGRLD